MENTNNDKKISQSHSFMRFLFKLPAPIIIITLAILSSHSSLPGVQLFPGIDKFYHFVAYGALGVAFGLWFSRESWLKQPLRNFLICTAIVSIYGAIDEIHQYFVPDRVCDVWDWVADTLGGAAGAGVVLLCNRIIIRRDK
ncbi:MAG: VanZ family protein [Treponema sp.]|jgi:VanZ family protein|nr:VanZ family protein [Treponema sp.]